MSASQRPSQSCSPCWCCMPIGPARPEPLPQRTIAEIEAMAEELKRLYYEAHPEERS